jgi:hypothetical protein
MAPVQVSSQSVRSTSSIACLPEMFLASLSMQCMLTVQCALLLHLQPLKPVHAHWKAMLDASPHLVDALQHVTTIAQATVLMPGNWQKLIQGMVRRQPCCPDCCHVCMSLTCMMLSVFTCSGA